MEAQLQPSLFWEPGVIKLCSLGKGLPGAPSGPPACSEGLREGTGTTPNPSHHQPQRQLHRERSSWKTNSACWIKYLYLLERGTRLREHSRVPRQLQVTKHLSATKSRTLLAAGLLLLGSPCGLVNTESQNHPGWKRPSGPSSPTISPAPLNVPKCHIQCPEHFHGQFTSLGNLFQC